MPNDTKSLLIENCEYLHIPRYAIFDKKDLESLEIRNISHLSVEKDGLSVSQKVSLRIFIANSSCDDYLPKFSAQNSYESVQLQNVKVNQNCSCQNDSTYYLCKVYNDLTEEIEFQKYEQFDESNCDHEDHHHSIFEDFLEELPDDKYLLIGNVLDYKH